MWPFSTEPTETARRMAEERQREKEEEARRFLMTPMPEDVAHKAVHLEEDEEYVFVGPAVVPPTEPVFGAKGEAGPTGPVGPRGEHGIPGPDGMPNTIYGVPSKAIRDLHTMSIKTGIKPETLLGILESAIDELPNTLLKEMREL